MANYCINFSNEYRVLGYTSLELATEDLQRQGHPYKERDGEIYITEQTLRAMYERQHPEYQEPVKYKTWKFGLW